MKPRGNGVLLASAYRSTLENDRDRHLKKFIDSVPPIYRTLDFDSLVENIQDDDQIALVQEISQTGEVQPSKKCGSFLVMSGSVGTGKSSLAVAIGEEVLENSDSPKSGLFAQGPEFMRQLSFESLDWVPVYGSVDVLIIDDLGVVDEGITSHQHRMLWDIIENRWNDPGKLTIITTNMPLNTTTRGGAGLSEWLGESIWDRISDRMLFITININSKRGSF